MKAGAWRLFRVAGIDVYLHWSWLVVAAIELQARKDGYASPLWNVLEYLSLFGIVLLHEFGHALACRSVGGRADTIVLWPLGGVAVVAPPPRPGPTLWSIAAGPLVNVVLMPVFFVAVVLASGAGWEKARPDLYNYLFALAVINAGLLVFNVLPIYPLDGGQIVRALLWFVVGRARSLTAAASLGLVGVAGVILLAVVLQSIWTGLIAVMILGTCVRGLRQAKMLAQAAEAPRRPGLLCPACRLAPPVGPWWTCPRCPAPFDTFASGASCPGCATRFESTACVECGAESPQGQWAVVAQSAPPA